MILPPLPDWGALLGAAVPSGTDPAALAQPWLREGEAGGWLSRSAWSLALVATWRQGRTGRVPVVWLPDYFCNASLEPLRRLRATLHFYPVTPHLAPDLPQLPPQAKVQPPDIVVLVHYFGMAAPASALREFCKLQGAWLVEDAAHVLVPSPGIGTEGDFVLYSPHKLLALPHGALLVARPDGASRLGVEAVAGFGPPAQWAHQVAQRPAAPAGTVKWVLKRALQKAGWRPRPRPEPFDFDAAPGLPPPPALGGFAMRLVARTARSLDRAARLRERHLLLLDELVARDRTLGLEPAWRAPGVPYVAAYRSADAAQAFGRLRARGVPATTWPDLPPEVKAGAGTPARNLRATHVFLPVHQALRESDLLRAFPPPAETPTAAPEWVEVRDRAEWDGLLQRAGRSNLLQSWSYGDSKAARGPWVARRFQLVHAGRPVAVVQVLQRSVAGLLVVSRINRGPLFLPGSTPAIEHACLRAVARRFGRMAQGKVLSWAPERRLAGPELVQVHTCGFRPLGRRGWSSAFVDLRQDEAQLRSGLAGKWRNMLNGAARHGIPVEEPDGPEVFETLLARCGDMMQSRGASFPADLYRDLHARLGREGTPGVLLALRRDGELLAATWSVVHGASATYLLGWAGEQGRRVNAHHLLLWETMLRLRARGIAWLDVGGIDRQQTPGVAAFKEGMGGEPYRLVGEGWSA